MSIFSKNAQRLPLSPQARAFLAFLWHLLLSSCGNALLAAGQVVYLYIMQHGNLSTYAWLPVIALQAWNVAMALLVGIRKYITAHADMAYAPVMMTVDSMAMQDLQSIQPAPLPASSQQNTQTTLQALNTLK